jgi:hypothetical protein
MKSIKHLLYVLLSKVNAFFGFRYCSGTMTLFLSGTKTIAIDTGFTPDEVWINLKDPKGCQTCGSDMDCFDWRRMPNGFVLIVRLASEEREVEWIAK